VRHRTENRDLSPRPRRSSSRSRRIRTAIPTHEGRTEPTANPEDQAEDGSALTIPGATIMMERMKHDSRGPWSRSLLACVTPPPWLPKMVAHATPGSGSRLFPIDR
jgi:hypothetical protein